MRKNFEKRKETGMTEKFSTGTMCMGIVGAIVILVVAQTLVLLVGSVLMGIGLSGSVCNIVIGILYVLFTLAGVSILCKKVLKIPMSEMRIEKFKVKGIWMIVAVSMPVIVVGVFLIIGGQWEIHTFDTPVIWMIATGAVIFYGLATGIVEEVIFRGIIMGCLEKRVNIQAAVIFPSVLFGALHIVGNQLDLMSMIQLLVAGSIVGILFSMITYETHSIWNSAIVHGIWNMVMIGGILHIGNQSESSAIFNFVLENKMFLLSGGDFGIEASVVSIIVYLSFTILAAWRIKKKNNKNY